MVHKVNVLGGPAAWAAVFREVAADYRRAHAYQHAMPRPCCWFTQPGASR